MGPVERVYFILRGDLKAKPIEAYTILAAVHDHGGPQCFQPLAVVELAKVVTLDVWNKVLEAEEEDAETVKSVLLELVEIVKEDMGGVKP